jgi:hypothetical protein
VSDSKLLATTLNLAVVPRGAVWLPGWVAIWMVVVPEPAELPEFESEFPDFEEQPVLKIAMPAKRIGEIRLNNMSTAL